MIQKDIYKFQNGDVDFGLSIPTEDHLFGYKGHIYYNLQLDTGKVISGDFPNTVTLDAGILLARIMKGPAGILPNTMVPSFSILGLAVGTGDMGWNGNVPPPATNTQRSLYNEIARKAILTSSFINSTGSMVGYPTRVIDLTTTFGPSEAVGPLKEMGLIGGDSNSSLSIKNPILPPNGVYDSTLDTTGKDCLVNYSTFPVINKPAGSTLSFTWRLTF